jgi:hypothetical protein
LGPVPDEPPTPVAGAPEGNIVLAVGGVTDDVAAGVDDRLADANALLAGDGLMDGDGLIELDMPPPGVPDGGVVLVVYVLAPTATDTKMDWVNVLVPVPPGPLQHSTTHSTVPPDDELTPAKLSSALTLPSSVPVLEPLIVGPNGAVRPVLIVPEIADTRTPPGTVNSVT